MRLTHKHKYKTDNKRYVFDMKDYRKACQKLGQYEDIDDDPKHLEKIKKALEIVKETLPIEEEDFFYDKETDTYFFIGYKVSKEKYNFLKEVLL